MTRAKYIESIVADFHAVKQALQKCMRPAVGSIPGSQWLVLSVIARKGSVSTKDIRESLGISSSAATQLVDALVKDGRVVRKTDLKDQRATAISLSSGTEKLFKLIRKDHIKSMTKVFAALDNRELAEYAALHRKIAEKAAVKP